MIEEVAKKNQKPEQEEFELPDRIAFQVSNFMRDKAQAEENMRHANDKLASTIETVKAMAGLSGIWDIKPDGEKLKIVRRIDQPDDPGKPSGKN